MVMSVDDLKELTMNGADFGAVDFAASPGSMEKFYVIFKTETYEDADGDNQLTFYAELAQDGAILRLCSPKALNASGGKAEIYLASCMAIQAKSFVFKFEYDENDGEVMPCVEIPVPQERSLSPPEMYQPMLLIRQALDKNYAALEATKETGEVLTLD